MNPQHVNAFIIIIINAGFMFYFNMIINFPSALPARRGTSCQRKGFLLLFDRQVCDVGNDQQEIDLG